MFAIGRHAHQYDRDCRIAVHSLSRCRRHRRNKCPQDALPLWSIDIGFNKYLQTNYKISEAPVSLESEMMMQFDPEAIYKNEKSQIVVADAIHLSSGKPFYTGELANCQ